MNKNVNKKQLGVFWGTEAISFVETTGTDPEIILDISLEKNQKSSYDGTNLIPGNIQLSTNIEKKLEESNVTSSIVNLSLPAKDIIFRFFIIPWMQANEVKGVVEFEVSKYIPFSLSELSYSYHPMTISQNGQKKIRIIFVAVKKDTLDNYLDMLGQASLDIGIVEPAPLSIIRTLSLRNLVPQEESIAIVEKEETSGKIIVVDKGIPQFVREFRLRRSTQENEPVDPKSLMNNLINEIRISLDYFNRQDNQIQIKKTIMIAQEKNEELEKALNNNLKMPSQIITVQDLTAKDESAKIDSLNAFGSALIGSVGSAANFNLSNRKLRPVKIGRPSSEVSANYKAVALVAVVCVAILLSTFFLSTALVKDPRKELADVQQKLDTNKDISVDYMKDQTTKLNERLNRFKSYRTTSRTADFLETIPPLLPEGTWLKNLTINYSNVVSKNRKKSSRGSGSEEIYSLSIDLSGFAYLKNQREQFGLVNRFLKNLKENKLFSDQFDDISMSNVKSQQLEGSLVTFFQIRCKY